MSFSKSSRGGKKDPLSKKIPDNPRYAHVKHVVDSGSSVNSYLRHLDEIKQNYRYRKDEIFKRLKATTFAQLILQIELYDNQEMGARGRLTPEAAIESPDPQYNEEPSDDTPRSTLSSVIHGMGEMDVKEMYSSTDDNKPSGPPPYLLLDVRDREEYEQSHITTAKHYPPSMLSRTCNYFTPEILEYKNKPGKIIVIYDEDERIAPRVITTFIQREIDNVFMLSGGMKVLYKLFPEGMITGKIPSTLIPSPPTSSRSARSGTRSSSVASRNKRSSSVTSTKTHSLKAATDRNLASMQQPETVTVLQNKFSDEDLYQIQSYLDAALLSGPTGPKESRASSRASSSDSVYPTTATNAGHSSRASSSQRVSAIPWK